MLTPLSLSVPVDARFRTLASDIAGKYAELCGCAAADVGHLKSSVAAAFASVANGLDNAAAVALDARVAGDHVEVTLRATGVRQTTTVRCAAPAGSAQ